MINEYLNFLNESVNPKILYHAASELTKTLKPRVSSIGHTNKMKNSYARKSWEANAVFAATEKYMCYPFGLERINLLWPDNYTQAEVEAMKRGCYLTAHTVSGPKRLKICYWNYTPKKPFYLYTVDSKDFKLINDKLGAIVEQWYSKKEITPLKVEKIYPNQVKESWMKISDKTWRQKLDRYIEKGYYKDA